MIRYMINYLNQHLLHKLIQNQKLNQEINIIKQVIKITNPMIKIKKLKELDFQNITKQNVFINKI